MADAADVQNIIDVLLQCGECNDIFEQVEMFQGHPCFDKNNNSCESTPEVKRKKKSSAASSSNEIMKCLGEIREEQHELESNKNN